MTVDWPHWAGQAVQALVALGVLVWLAAVTAK